MITHLLFFLLVLLLIGIAPSDAACKHPNFLLKILGAYALLIGVIYLQAIFEKKWLRRHKRFFYLLTQCEILLFLAFCYFYLNIKSLLPQQLPLFYSQFFATLIPLLFYFCAIALYHYTSFYSLNRRSAYLYAARQIKILIPFALPFLVFTLFMDLSTGLHLSENETAQLAVLISTVCFSAFLLPPAICFLWDCHPLHDSVILQRLEGICKKAHFTHGGLKQWNLFEFTPTAAILGIIPRFRYILFTPSLLSQLSPKALEAVLAHEIGHSKHRHLLFFPFVLYGMVLFVSLILETLLFYFPILNAPLFLFFLYALLLAFFFRYALGFFSRLFERQADLYGLQIGIPPTDMIEALDTIGKLTGNSHKTPNWHHFSLEERILFLKKVAKNPQLAVEYHHYVFIVRLLFILVLGIASALSFFFF
ncbi:hypothetical protein PHSC3_001987 [Chlamydiales bacterium STE3]|nr:hypothetical protein PHSC3_001987 [Chlamydiales bacterium STE3]